MRPCAWRRAISSSSRLSSSSSSSSSSLVRPSPAPISEFGQYFPLYPQRHNREPATSAAPHPVPSRIVRPHYVPADFWARHTGGPPDTVPPEAQGGKVQLGGEEEKGVRAAAQLAKRILDEAGRLVKVRRNGRGASRATVPKRELTALVRSLPAGSHNSRDRPQTTRADPQPWSLPIPARLLKVPKVGLHQHQQCEVPPSWLCRPLLTTCPTLKPDLSSLTGDRTWNPRRVGHNP